MVRPFFPEVNVSAICGHDDEGKDDSAQKEVTEGENYSLWFLPFCPFALMPSCLHALALAPVMVLFFIYVLAAIKRRPFLYLFSHFSSCADIVDSPDVTLVCTDDNKDLYLSETN